MDEFNKFVSKFDQILRVYYNDDEKMNKALLIIRNEVQKNNGITDEIHKQIKVMLARSYASLINTKLLSKNIDYKKLDITVYDPLLSDIKSVNSITEHDPVYYNITMDNIINEIIKEQNKDPINPQPKKKSFGEIIKNNRIAFVVGLIFMIILVIEIVFIAINAILCAIVISKYGKSFEWYEYLLIFVPMLGTYYYAQYLF